MKKRSFVLGGVLAASVCLAAGLLFLGGCSNPFDGDSDSAAPLKKSISFEVKGGKAPSSVYTNGNEKIKLPAPTKEGYSFGGWYYDDLTFDRPCRETDFVQAPLTENIKVYAQWNPENDIRLSARQNGQTTELTVAYDFNGFGIDGYEEWTMNFSYRDQPLASRRIGSLSSQITQSVCYGSVNVSLTAYDQKFGKVVLQQGTAALFADEYNFASLNATFPVTHFSLGLYSRRGEARDAYLAAGLPVMADAPTFVSLERAKAYDWDNLPENVSPLPAAPREEVVEGNFHAHNVLMAAYIKELYEINPASTFHFYCTDNYPELILQFFTCQGIDNFTATMISDGSGTIAYFNDMFGDENAKEQYDKMVTEWLRVKQAAAEGDEHFLENVYEGAPTYSVLGNYAFVIASVEENVSWWCSRADLFTNNTRSEFIKDLVNGTNVSKDNPSYKQINAVYPGLAKMLASLTETDQNGFKRLYKFDEEIFNDAYENEQKVLLVIGTKTENLGDLENYVNLLKTYYGSEYRIYYKGHPGTPTELDPGKQSLLNELGVVDVNSSVAAELILFYCPDIYLVGYPSTTFQSAYPERILALFNITKEEWKEQESLRGYKAAVYFSLLAGEDGKTRYKIQFDDKDEYAVYDPETDVITKYDKNGTPIK